MEIEVALFNSLRRSQDGLGSFRVELRDGDRVAFSGPVPFSRAYGAPVV